MAYAPTPVNPSEPVGGNLAGSAAEEFRKLKEVGQYLLADADHVQYVNTAVAQQVLLTTVKAGYMYTWPRTLKLEAHGRFYNATGGNVSFIIAINFGGGTVFSYSYVGATGLNGAWILNAAIKNNGVAAEQYCVTDLTIFDTNSAAGTPQNQLVRQGAVKQISVNTALDAVFEFDMQMNVANANAIIDMNGARLLIG